MSINVSWLKKPLTEADSEVYEIISKEHKRQCDGLELIASENYVSSAVLQAVGSCLTNKYSDGYPGERVCYGTENIDDLETLCQTRALNAFHLHPDKWGVNVQCYSGSPANFAVFTAILEPRNRIMALDFADGGHFTHGLMTNKKKLSATSKFFETMPYKVNPSTGLIDYDQLADSAALFKPQLLIAGVCCYSRLLDYRRMRSIADDSDAYLMGDIAHVAGLVAGGVIPSPFEYCDIVTTTTHKSLRGPRSGLIFYRKGVRYPATAKKAEVKYDLERLINAAVFPGLQSGPHNHAIAGVAVALGEALTPQFVEYQTKVLENARVLCDSLIKKGYHIVTGGTDTHLLLVDLKNKETDGKLVEKVLDAIGISCNKFGCPGQKSFAESTEEKASNPRGLRFGSPALTSRGFGTAEFEKVADFIDKGVQLTIEIQSSLKETATFEKFLTKLNDDPYFVEKKAALKNEVLAFIKPFPLPGLDKGC